MFDYFNRRDGLLVDNDFEAKVVALQLIQRCRPFVHHKHCDGKYGFYLAPQDKGLIAELVAEYWSQHPKGQQ